MTTAARPTWNPATGGSSLRDTGKAPTLQVSSREVVVEAPLKLRHEQESAKSLFSEPAKLRELLEQKERSHFLKVSKENSTFDEERETKKRREFLEDPGIDDDVALSDSGSERESDSEDTEGCDSDSGSGIAEDEEAELQRELEKVRREREEENRARLAKEAKDQKEVREQQALVGNPLLQPVTQDFSVTRKWYDDVIFKNQARGVREVPKKRFISDILRSDFHRRFMDKYT